MYLLILTLPLFGAISAGFFGKFIGRNGAIFITIFCMFITFLLACLVFYEVALSSSPCYIILFTWIRSELIHVYWGCLFDTLTSIMLIVVICVSLLVHIFSTEYMSGDPHLQRFMSYLSLFTFFMIILVTADNFVQMFVGWEGVGLCSYLLINFWFNRIQANKAAIKAMLVNRVGDIGIIFAMAAIFYTFQTLEYSIVFASVPALLDHTVTICGVPFNSITVICLFLFIGAVGKSAQLGLHTWLPDAMEGPTPVSALIHAATMVTAGVFLIARCSPLFEYSSSVLFIVTVVGAMTAFFAATTGLLQNDLKRVIAYSTCSQLGYMVFACGLSAYPVGIFHLANHAFFKALLFLSAGSVIHAMADEQDMRKMGGLVKLLPFTYAMMFLGSLALMGFPFLTGFYSKDIILEIAYSKYTFSSHFAYWLGLISAFFTAFYSMRLLYLTFLSKTNAYKQVIVHSHDAPIVMAFPLTVLAFGSVFFGYIMKDMCIGIGTDFWGNSLFILPQASYYFEIELLPGFIKLLPVIFSLSGAFSAYFYYHYKFKTLIDLNLSPLGKILYIFFNRKWLFDKIYTVFVSQTVLTLCYEIIYKNIDRGILEDIGPLNISSTFASVYSYVGELQSGYLMHYLRTMFFGLILIFSFVILLPGSVLEVQTIIFGFVVLFVVNRSFVYNE